MPWERRRLACTWASNLPYELSAYLSSHRCAS